MIFKKSLYNRTILVRDNADVQRLKKLQFYLQIWFQLHSTVKVFFRVYNFSLLKLFSQFYIQKLLQIYVS